MDNSTELEEMKRTRSNSIESDASMENLLPSPMPTTQSTICHDLLKLVGLSRGSPGEMGLSPTKRFAAWFQRQFGEGAPEFFDGSYVQALEEAMSKGKFMFVYIHSEEHDDTELFCRNILLNEEIVSFINENCICYVVDVKDMEGFSLSRMLQVTRFPFSCLMTKYSRRAVVKARSEGLSFPVEFMAQLLMGHRELLQMTTVIPQEQKEHSETRQILREQDREYEEALERDRQLLREREEEEKMKKLQLQRMEEEKRKAEAEMASKVSKRNALPDEPSAGKDVVTVQFRLPDGEKLRRRFLKRETFGTLLDYVSTFDIVDLEGNPISNWELMANYPTRFFKDPNQSLADANLSGQCVLYVREQLS